MHNNQISNNDLPSKAQLVKSTIIAAGIALVILVTAILPAEYGIDPTGIGKLIGLTKMGEIKTSLAKDAAIERAKDEAMKAQMLSAKKPKEVAPVKTKIPKPNDDINTDSMTFTLKPDEATEIKLAMLKGNKVTFSWTSDNGEANFDTHGDSKPLNIKYHNYAKGSKDRDEGTLEASFDGHHGWFWRNRTSGIMNITLEVSGEFSDIKKVL
ncbi:MAG: transmembrane anchor protein [Candidatus Marinimicrobia bacterium]|nr:transmembrane anchor protein [Candidatus Neomarinimicrobiota bacterium]